MKLDLEVIEHNQTLNKHPEYQTKFSNTFKFNDRKIAKNYG